MKPSGTSRRGDARQHGHGGHRVRRGAAGDPTGHGRFPGDVAPGYVRWGAAVGGNSDPTQRHESPSGKSMGIRRTYYSWAERDTTMVDTARSDLAERSPSLGVDQDAGWALMASGQYDGEIDSMLRALDDVGGPVWLTVHHEPEGGAVSAAGPMTPAVRRPGVPCRRRSANG